MARARTKTKRFRGRYVIINLIDFTVRIARTKDTAASIIGCHRNTLPQFPTRVAINNFLFIPTTEE